MKKIIAIPLLLVFLCAVPAYGGQPTQTLKVGLDELLTVLKDPQYATEEGVSDEHLEALRGVVFNFFDFGELTRRAVGKTWTTFTDDQRERLVKVFTKLLEKTYIRKLNTQFLEELNGFDGKSIQYLEEKVQGKLAMVNTKLKLTDKELAVDFKLISKQDKWWVYDIIGEGLTLLGIYKDDFRSALLKQTPDELIASLEQRIKDIEAGRADAQAQ
ncbi:MAG: ABC transporter substrate-binding protein [Proteobacteria bacterium]|nr:ABC transporter substrate-binding protein [Pseudomonadota bacterium]MBU1610714.1 ABC transporter substrate-binding protein [Pseudomonadota bacterium]